VSEERCHARPGCGPARDRGAAGMLCDACWERYAATPAGVRRTRALARLKTAIGAAARGELDHDLRAYQAQEGLAMDGAGGPATYARLAWVRQAA
jgi:hypothetical protein